MRKLLILLLLAGLLAGCRQDDSTPPEATPAADGTSVATDATAEVERYIAIPSQALAYKIGALTIQRLKAKAKTALGDKFDVREFHNQILNTGALPLTVLEKKIDDWIASQK